jgi:hypothetical protein
MAISIVEMGLGDCLGMKMRKSFFWFKMAHTFDVLKQLLFMNNDLKQPLASNFVFFTFWVLNVWLADQILIQTTILQLN